MNRCLERAAVAALIVVLLGSGPSTAFEFPIPWSHAHPEQRRTATVTPLPFAFHSQFFEWTAGVYIQSKHLVRRDAEFDVVLFGSSNGTRYLYHQMRRYRMPGLPRLYVQPTVFYGRFGEIRAYTDMPGSRIFPGTIGESFPGHNDSDPDHYIPMEGRDQWYRVNFRWLLPIGDGRDAGFSWPRLERGRLQANPSGGHAANPLLSGRTFLEVEPYYRKQLTTVIAGATVALTRENWDLEDNPSRGSYQRVAWQRNVDRFDSQAPWSIVELDLRWYVPLSSRSDPNPTVLAFNLWTMDCLSWENEHTDTAADGSRTVVPHRPPAFAAPALGSDERFRAYYQSRYNNRSMAYLGAEWRRMLGWNPFGRLPVHWVQAVLFGELGRVAPSWSPRRFALDPKLSAGAGMRAMFTDQVLRLDLAVGNEGPLLQMFMAQAF